MAEKNFDGPRRKILLIEDNAVDVSLVRLAIQKRGFSFELVTASTGEEGLRVIEGSEGGLGMIPDLILLDLYLPDIDGKQVLNRIRTNPALATVPVMVMTSSTSETDREAVLSAGANEFFSKPLEMSSFVKVGKLIEEALRRARSANSSR
jgi:CheY-like chemotaxis protein